MQNVQESGLEVRESVDELTLVNLTTTYAELVDSKGKKWIVGFGNDEWREDDFIEDNATLFEGKETAVPFKQLKFKNRESAFVTLKIIAFKEEMRRSVLIAQKHNLDSSVYEKVLQVLEMAEAETDSDKREKLFKEAFKINEEEA